MSYLFWACVHIVGVFGFQYTESIWFLSLGTLHAAMNMFIFMFGVSAALTPNFEVEKLDGDKHKDFGYRFLMQMGIILTAVQIYMLGYGFFAGMLFLQAVVLAMTVVYQKIFDVKE